MERFPPKFSKVLVTPDPQYIPGYAGYCIMEVSCGPDLWSVNSKAPIFPGGVSLTEEDSGPRDEIWRSRHGGSRNLEKMIPGFAILGFVPLCQNYFCKTYAETCRDALSEFNQEQEKRLCVASADLSFAFNNSVPDFRAPDPWKPQGSPYLMEESSPHKYFISGFTGYVPKARFLFGAGYPVITNKALIQFGKEMKAGLFSFNLKKEESVSLPLIPTIYLSKTGLLPSYMGHIPGYRFQYGHTFGKLTNDALGHIGTQKNTGESRLD